MPLSILSVWKQAKVLLNKSSQIETSDLMDILPTTEYSTYRALYFRSSPPHTSLSKSKKARSHSKK